MRAELPFRSILTGYGLTEAGTCTGSRPDDDAETIATTAGRAMAGLEIIIADSKGREVARDATGELLVRGYSVMQGYLDDPEATAAAIDDRGFLHTGDLATMDDRGYVRIVGRLKDMLIVGGFNVYPAEVENTLLAHDAIGQVAVIGVPDERMGEVARGVRRRRLGTVGRSRRDHRLGPRAPRQLQGAAARGRRCGAADQRRRQGREGRAPRPCGRRPGRKMNADRRERWSVRRVPPDLERAYIDGGWWTDDTFGAMVARQLAAHPASTVAIWSRSRGWRGSYADIDDEARRLVTLLREMGAQPGDAVAFQLPNWREAVVSFAALALGGYVVVPIVHIYGRKEVAFILEQSGAVAYISPLAYGHVDYGAIVDTAAPASLRLHVVVGADRGSAEPDPASPGSAGRRAPNGSRRSTSLRCNRRMSRCSRTRPGRPAIRRA